MKPQQNKKYKKNKKKGQTKKYATLKTKNMKRLSVTFGRQFLLPTK